MLILGPNTISNGLDTETAFVSFSGEGCAILGPVEGPSTEVDPIARLFVVLGKIIAARRVVTQDRVTDPRPPAAVETFGALQSVVLGYKDSSPHDEFELVWAPLARQIERTAIGPLTANVADLDQRTRRFIAAETHAILALDPRATVEQRMESIDTYLRVKGYTVEQTAGGFRDFIAGSFKDTEGRRVNLPTSTDPSFPDSWITPVPVDPQGHGGSRRQWNIIW